MPPGWLLVSVLAPAILLWTRPRWSVVHSMIAVLMIWAAITARWAPVTAVALDALWKMGLGLLLFCIGFEVRNLDRVYILAGLALGVSSGAAIYQAMAGQYPVIGLFGNPNMLGEAAALVVVGLIAGDFRSWIVAGLAVLPALVLSQARGALLAALVGLAGYRSAIVLILVCGAAVLLLPAQRDFLSTNSMIERATIWSDTVSQLEFFGHGIGGYAESLNSTLSYRVVEHAHNDLLELFFELGAPGLLLALLIGSLILASAGQRERLVLAALGVEAMFGFPFHTPATAAIGLVVAGHASRGWAGVFHGLAAGSPTFRGWHGVSGRPREDGRALDRVPAIPR